MDFPEAPTYAIPAALERAGLKIDDIAHFEINEAFSVVVRIAEKVLGVDSAKINPNGYVLQLHSLRVRLTLCLQWCCGSRSCRRQLWLSYRCLLDSCIEVWTVWCGRYLQWGE